MAMGKWASGSSAKVSELDLITLQTAVDEHVRPSYMASLRKCEAAGLCTLEPLKLTAAGRTALASLK